MHSLLYGLLCGFQCLIQAVFLDEIIDKFLNLNFFSDHWSFYIVTVSDMSCTIISLLALFRLGREEWRELRTFGLGGLMSMGSAVVDESFSKDSKNVITDLNLMKNMRKHHINRIAMSQTGIKSTNEDDDSMYSKKRSGPS